MIRIRLPLFAFSVFLLFLPSCKNFFGNPHKVATPPRVVPAQQVELHAEPAGVHAGAGRREVEVLFQYPGLAAYRAQLGACVRVTLLRAEPGDSPDCLTLTLRIGRKAPPQKVPVVFTNGARTLTYEFRIWAAEDAPKR